MLTNKDLDNNQDLFRLDSDGNYYSPYWDYQISKHKGKLALFLHCEVDGSTELLCDEIEDIEHLNSLVDMLNIESFDR